MATIELATASQRKIWSAKRYDEYVRASGFRPFMGKDPSNIIHVRSELRNERGDTINIPLFAKLKGSGKRGSTPIEGNEQGMANYNFPILIDWVGDGVAVSNADQFRTEIDLLNAGRTGLVNLMGEITRDDIIEAMHSKDGVKFADASVGVKNTWNVNNADRVLYGAALPNYNATFATALLNVDATADKLSKTVVTLARYVARTANPLVRPAMVEENNSMANKGAIVEMFVMFVGARSFYHLKQDPTMQNDLRMSMERGVNNPIFKPGDIIVDNVIVREIPEVSTLALMAGAGAAAVDVEPAFLCGAQAIGYAVGQDPQFATNSHRDYGFIKGVAVRELRGIEKNRFNNKDHGMVTVFVAAPLPATP